MNGKWKNFAVQCANCDKEGKPSLLGPLTYSPIYKTFTVSHGLCRRHELNYLVEARVAKFPEFYEWVWLEMKDAWRTLKGIINV